MNWFDFVNKEKNKAEEEKVETIIGETMVIRGEIHSSTSVQINGEVEGIINCEADVIVSQGGKVKGNIKGRKVLVGGEVLGDIHSKIGIEIFPTGKVFGDISGDKLVMDEGAIYRGKVNMEISQREAEPALNRDGSGPVKEDFTRRIIDGMKMFSQS